IPVQPGQHYSMGGIDCNYDGETQMLGLYAAGECSCVSVHGANRLGGNSLLETIVFGKRSGEKLVQYVKGGAAEPAEAPFNEAMAKSKAAVESLFKGNGKEDPPTIRLEMKDVMFNNVGIFREEKPMRDAVSKVKELRERCRHFRPIKGGQVFNLDLQRAYELPGMLELAEAISTGALTRQESRGSHSRLDFKMRDDQTWMKHTLAQYTPDGPELSYKEVAVTKWQPEERKY
ncbi:MAG: FAD-binding protein, partial [Dehalococcoidia bacterium]|nr:FAD-binding protein [Dehalococcoidia bacterium]